MIQFQKLFPDRYLHSPIYSVREHLSSRDTIQKIQSFISRTGWTVKAFLCACEKAADVFKPIQS